MYERMKQSYLSKGYLDKRSERNLLNQPKISYPSEHAASGDLTALESHLQEEFSSGILASPERPSLQYLESLRDFAQEIIDEPRQRPAESGVELKMRTSYESPKSSKTLKRANCQKAPERVFLQRTTEVDFYQETLGGFASKWPVDIILVALRASMRCIRLLLLPFNAPVITHFCFLSEMRKAQSHLQFYLLLRD
jgi:hypothetical protein